MKPVHKERWYKLFSLPRSTNQIDYILIVSDWIFVIVSQNDSHQAGTGHSLASGWSPPRSADVSRCENLNFISHLYHGLQKSEVSGPAPPTQPHADSKILMIIGQIKPQSGWGRGWRRIFRMNQHKCLCYLLIPTTNIL